MKRMGSLLVICVAVSLLGAADVDTKKIVGTWIVESGPEGLPKGVLFEFTKDGKMKVGLEVNGKAELKDAGSYEIKDDIIALKTGAKGSKDGKAHIVTLTDEKMVLKDDQEPKEIVFKRKK